MRITFPKLKSRSWLLLVLFLLAASGSSFFAGLSFERARHLSSQQDEPITGWMSLNYVAHAYHVPSETLHQALGLEPFPPDRRTLKEIAEERGLPLDALRLRLEHAIDQSRRRPSPEGAAEAER